MQKSDEEVEQFWEMVGRTIFRPLLDEMGIMEEFRRFEGSTEGKDLPGGIP